MDDEKEELLNLIDNSRFEDALLCFQNLQSHCTESFRKFSTDIISNTATKFRDNNDDDLRAFILALFGSIHPDALKLRICLDFMDGRTSPHFDELLAKQLRSVISPEFIEKHPYEWEELCNVLPLKLEERLSKEDDPDVLDSALAVANVLYFLKDVPFVFPERMKEMFAAAVHSREMDLPRTFPLLYYYSKYHSFSPKLLEVYEPATLIPCVYSRSSLGKYLISGLTTYLLENEYSYEKFFVRPIVLAVDRIASVLDSLDTCDIPMCSKLILLLLRFIEDFEQQSYRVSIMNKCQDIIHLFSSESRVLLIKRVLSMVLRNSDLRLENEAAIVAWFVDLYRRNLDEPSFRGELGSFLGMLENTRYDDMALAINYYSSVFILIQTVAIKTINPAMLPEIEARLIKRVYDQLRDYIQLEQLKKKEKEKSKEVNVPVVLQDVEVGLGPPFFGSTVDQLQLIMFECEQARNYITEASRNCN